MLEAIQSILPLPNSKNNYGLLCDLDESIKVSLAPAVENSTNLLRDMKNKIEDKAH